MNLYPSRACLRNARVIILQEIIFLIDDKLSWGDDIRNPLIKGNIRKKKKIHVISAPARTVKKNWPIFFILGGVHKLSVQISNSRKVQERNLKISWLH